MATPQLKRDPIYFEDDDGTNEGFDLSQLNPKQLSLLARSGGTEGVTPKGLGSSYSQQEASLLSQAGQQAGAGKIAVPNVQQVNKYNLDPRSMGGDFDRLEESLAQQNRFETESPDPSEGDTTFSSEDLVAPDYSTTDVQSTLGTLGKGFGSKMAAGLAITGKLMPAIGPLSMLAMLFALGYSGYKDYQRGKQVTQHLSNMNKTSAPFGTQSFKDYEEPLDLTVDQSGLPSEAMSFAGMNAGKYDLGARDFGSDQNEMGTFDTSVEMPGYDRESIGGLSTAQGFGSQVDTGYGGINYNAPSGIDTDMGDFDNNETVSGHGSDYDYDSTGASGYY